jgi:hypothetical protein
MGTRADFYVGRGESAEWLGSIAYDGYPEGEPGGLLKIGDEAKFRKRVDRVTLGRVLTTTTDDEGPWLYPTYAEHLWRVAGLGVERVHPTREGAIAAWRAAVKGAR